MASVSPAEPEIRKYGRSPSLAEIPSLCEIQKKFYAEFLQADVLPQERKEDGLETVFREVTGDTTLNLELCVVIELRI